MTRSSAADLRRQQQGASRTDLARLHRMTEAELEASIAADPDWNIVPRDWHLKAGAAMPRGKNLVSLRLDADMLDWFRSQGPGYQTRINAVLRAFMEDSSRRADAAAGPERTEARQPVA